MFKKGDIVKITKLSRKSYFLFKDWKQKSPLMVCPCELKHHHLEVSQEFPGGILLCQYKQSITILYSSDVKLLLSAPED